MAATGEAAPASTISTLKSAKDASGESVANGSNRGMRLGSGDWR